MTFLPVVFAYLGPETMLPMTSVVAGAAGLVMMFGRSSVRWLVGTYRRFAPASKTVAPSRRIGSAAVGTIESRVRG
jgi:hypothetical protein